jgi:Uma2 family endonuclease
MSAIATKTRITPQELERMPDSETFELVDGELVERHVSMRSSRVAAVVGRILDTEAARTKEAKVYANDLGYQCYPDDPQKIRRPDVSLIRSERLAGIDPDSGYSPIAADLVVEVISPNDLSYVVIEKVREYLAAGFPLVWVIHPNVRTVTVYSRGQDSALHQVREFEGNDEITAEPALSGFRCKVSAFFE